MRKILPAAFCCAALLSGGGCLSGKNPEVLLTEKDSGRTLRVESGDIVLLRVESNPTTGYIWKTTVVPDAAVMRVCEEKYEQNAAKRELCGVPGVKVYKYIVVGPGKAGLRLEYLRPWEHGTPPAKTLEFLFEATGKSPFLEAPPGTSERRVGSKGNIEYGPLPGERK